MLADCDQSIIEKTKRKKGAMESVEQVIGSYFYKGRYGMRYELAITVRGFEFITSS
jgi:hypothetical protein